MPVPGRQALLAELSAALGSGGGGTVVVLAGEAGIGKTTLAHALADGSRRRVTWGACEPLATTAPLLAIADWAATLGPAVTATLSGSDRLALFTAVRTALATEPTLAVVEDLHWADDATLDLVLWLTRRLPAGTSLLLTLRDDQSATSTRCADVVARATSASGGRYVAVPPLTLAEITALVAPAGLEPVPVAELTGGNAFFVSQLIDAPTAGVPASVREAVMARMTVLSDGARRVAECVALIPDRAELAVVYAVTGAEPADAEEAARAGLLIDDGDQLRFRHELAREAVASSLPGPRRTLLHAAILTVLRERPGTPAAAIAFHAASAGDADDAVTAALEAAEESLRHGAWNDAVAQLDRVGLLLDRAEPRHVWRLHRLSSEALTAANRSEEACASAAAAVAVARDLGDPDPLAESLARHGMAEWRRGHGSPAVALVDRAVVISRAAPESAGALRALVDRAYLHMLRREVNEAITVSQLAIELAERRGEDAALAEATHVLGTTLWFAEDDAAEEVTLRAARIAERLDDHRLVSICLTNLGSGAGEVRQYPTARRWLTQARDHATDHDLDGNRHYAQSWLARVSLELGDFADARELAASVPPEASTISVIGAETVLGRVAHRRGDADPLPHLHRAWGLAEETGQLQRLWPVAAGLVEHEGDDENLTRAESLVDEAVHRNHRWAVGELGALLVAAGRIRADDPRLTIAAEPYAAQIRDDQERAAALWTALGCRYDAAVAASRSAEPATVRRALADLDLLGARPAGDRVAASLRARGLVVPRRPRRTTAANPDGLTDRQSEVLALLRDGLTDGEIATRMFISPKTAGHHVSAVLAKVGVSSRRDLRR